MNTKVFIRRRGTGDPVYDKVTKNYTVPMTVVYSGAARIQPYGLNFDIEVGLDPTSRKLVLVQLEKNVDARVGDYIIVESVENVDQSLRKYGLEVRGAISGSLTWGTQLICEVDQKNVE